VQQVYFQIWLHHHTSINDIRTDGYLFLHCTDKYTFLIGIADVLISHFAFQNI